MRTLAIILAALVIALSPPVLAKSEKNDPPGQSGKSDTSNSPGQAKTDDKPEPPGQSKKEDKPEPPGQTKNDDKPTAPGHGKSDDKPTPPGQDKNGDKPTPPGQDKSGDKPTPPGQDKNGDKPTPPGQDKNGTGTPANDTGATGSIPPDRRTASPPKKQSTADEIETVLDAVETRQALPLAKIVAVAEGRSEGHVINARLVRVSGTLLYHLTLLDDDGRSWREYYYARTGNPVVIR